MSLCILTPTRGRPDAFRLLERWMAAQTACWDRWIVATDDDAGYEYTAGQEVVRTPDLGPGPDSLCRNVLAGLGALPEDCDSVIICEDDDYYAPDYVRTMASLLENADLVGDYNARYYHVRRRRWKVHRNGSHASLAQTGIRRPLFAPLAGLCRRGGPGLDLRLWSLLGPPRAFLDDLGGLHVGIKGMPGEAGIGVGHRDDMGETDDGSVFCDWGLPGEYLKFEDRGGSRPPPGRSVTIEAHGDRRTGYGRIAHHLGVGLEALGVPVRYDLLTRGPLTPFMEARSGAPPGDWVLRCRPPLVPGDGRASCWYSMWETTRASEAGMAGLAASHGVVVPSSWQAACFSAQGLDAPIAVAPLGVDPSEGFAPAPMPERFTVGMAGNLSHGGIRKNLEAGVAAWSEASRGVDDARLAIKVFPGDELALPRDPRISLDTVARTPSMMAEWTSGVSVLLVPSRGEGWGMHTIEAMAMGRPAIATDWGGSMEFLDERSAWLVPFALEAPRASFYGSSGVWAAPDHSGMVAALREAHASPCTLAEKGAQAAVRAAEFTWARTARETRRALVRFGMLRP